MASSPRMASSGTSRESAGVWQGEGECGGGVDGGVMGSEVVSGLSFSLDGGKERVCKEGEGSCPPGVADLVLVFVLDDAVTACIHCKTDGWARKVLMKTLRSWSGTPDTLSTEESVL